MVCPPYSATYESVFDANMCTSYIERAQSDIHHLNDSSNICTSNFERAPSKHHLDDLPNICTSYIERAPSQHHLNDSSHICTSDIERAPSKMHHLWWLIKYLHVMHCHPLTELPRRYVILMTLQISAHCTRKSSHETIHIHLHLALPEQQALIMSSSTATQHNIKELSWGQSKPSMLCHIHKHWSCIATQHILKELPWWQSVFTLLCNNCKCLDLECHHIKHKSTPLYLKTEKLHLAVQQLKAPWWQIGGLLLTFPFSAWLRVVCSIAHCQRREATFIFLIVWYSCLCRSMARC